ncbi:DNA-binding protein [Actinoplanes oblitus]|uniref:DNA-binding protein n=1 Tax=Actinoplanes oblitus TaxID=3040509 RepID=A0ABY8W4D9_9ACTN|nr:DNA-binding protein [Actinoplanes oblitus]WIM92573.1 DNA-binding protein [Actinoplanes oblitus]
MKRTKHRLMGTHEIQIRLGGELSRQRINQLTAKTHFPKPIAELKQGRVWLAEDIEDWIRLHRSQPARA